MFGIMAITIGSRSPNALRHTMPRSFPPRNKILDGSANNMVERGRSACACGSMVSNRPAKVVPRDCAEPNCGKRSNMFACGQRAPESSLEFIERQMRRASSQPISRARCAASCKMFFTSPAPLASNTAVFTALMNDNESHLSISARACRATRCLLDMLDVCGCDKTLSSAATFALVRRGSPPTISSRMVLDSKMEHH